MISIRRATLADALRIAELSGTLGYPIDPGTLHARLSRLLASEADLVVVAIPPSGDLAGWIHGTDREFLETGRHGEIVGLVVDAAQRGLGVGRALVDAVESWARTRGLDRVVVRSNVVRLESHPFYERIGYKRIKTQHVYRKGLNTNTIMPDHE
ncbi:MAG TPA: GNAT family N-acetyltransferase [Vicinamibacterales bacterium]|jgi:GNAT superfamily N-acetyltransferase